MFRLLFLLLIFITVPANAASFDEFLAKLNEHPQVEAILAESEKYKELSDGEMGLPDPQMIIGVDNVPVNDPAFDRFLPTSKVIGFRQQIPSYGLRKAKAGKQESISDKHRLMAEYTSKRLEAILIATLTELDKVKQLEEFANKQLAHYVELEDYIIGQVNAGEPVYARFSEVDVERTEVEQRLNNLKAERQTIEAELVRLVGEVPDISFPSIPHRGWNRKAESIYAVQIANEDINVASKGLEIADAGFDPNYGVQTVYKQRESASNFAGDDWFSVQATISIPLWAEWNQKPKLRAAKAKKRSAEYLYEDMKRMWIKKLTSLKAERDISLDNIKLLQEKEGALGEMVAAAERNYESGNANLENVLDAQIDKLTIASRLAKQRSRHIRLSAEFNSHLIGEEK